MQESLVEYFIFLTKTSFKPIKENAQFEIPISIQIYGLNADNPLYQLFRVTSCSCLHLLFIPMQNHVIKRFVIKGMYCTLLDWV